MQTKGHIFTLGRGPVRKIDIFRLKLNHRDREPKTSKVLTMRTALLPQIKKKKLVRSTEKKYKNRLSVSP